MKKKITFVVAFTTLFMVFSGCSTNKEPEATFVNPVYEIDGLTPLRDGIDEPYYYEYYMFENNDNVYKYADEYHNGMAPISQAGEFDFSGLSWTKYSGKWGFLNTKGELAIPMIYDYVYNFNNLGIACVGKVYHNFDKEYNRNKKARKFWVFRPKCRYSVGINRDVYTFITTFDCRKQPLFQ